MDARFVVFTLSSVIFGVKGSLWFSNYYSDHMVLQRAPQRAILWGYGDIIDDIITVFINGNKVEETTVTNDTNNEDTYGIWKVKLPPESDPGPHEIQVKSSEVMITLSDVMFGDVWLCSGQSNMHFSMSEVYNSEHEINDSLQYRDIRMISTEKVSSRTPWEDVEISHPWMYPVKGVIDNFSALCFMFARDLQKHLNYPIGLIDSSWGGTPIEVWSSPSAIEACKAKTKHRYWKTPSVLWNSMIHPYTTMTMKGVIWYQGEANRNNAREYRCQFPAMIRDWRKLFHARSDGETDDQFPFGFVQLAPYRSGEIIGGYPKARWAQTTNVGYVPNARMPNTFMAVAIDLPDFSSPSGAIHPRHKQDIAARLVLGARNLVYGDTDVTFQGPFPTDFGVRQQMQTMWITFDNDTKNLLVNNQKGFEICCANSSADCRKRRSWISVDIIRYRRSTVDIDVLGCDIQYIAGVRYLWRESPCALKQCALYDSHSLLPVPPFMKTFKTIQSHEDSCFLFRKLIPLKKKASHMFVTLLQSSKSL